MKNEVSRYCRGSIWPKVDNSMQNKQSIFDYNLENPIASLLKTIKLVLSRFLYFLSNAKRLNNDPKLKYCYVFIRYLGKTAWYWLNL